MNSRNDQPQDDNERWLMELAAPSDNPGLATVYACDDGFPGDIQVLFLRGEHPYESLRAEGDDVVVPIVRDAQDGTILGMGACVLRDAWVNGERRRVGYLTGLKGLPQWRGKVPVIPKMYAFLRRNTEQVELYYTTILSDNALARAFLETQRPGMPEYRHAGTYITHIFHGGHGRADRGTLDELMTLAGRDNLAVVEPPAGLTDADVRILRDLDGQAVAGCAVWDQQDHKQYVVTRYAGRYRWLSRLPLHLIGYPRLPKVGVPARYASVALLSAPNPDAASRLLSAIGAEFNRLDFVMVGYLEGSPLCTAVPPRSVHYSSELYTVHFEDGRPGLDERPVNLDVGLL